MKPFAFHREADEEFTDALRYYANISPALGRRFYAEIERLIKEICVKPTRSLASSAPRFAGTSPRRFLMRSYMLTVPMKSGFWLSHTSAAARFTG